MKKLYIVLVFSIFMAGAVWGQSEMRLSAENFDFGYVPQNAKVNCGIWIYSAGPDTLKIRQVRTSCGCTRAPLTKYTLPPGDSTFLEITFSSRQYQGELKRLIHIMYASDSLSKTFELKANVQRQMDKTEPLVVAPYKINVTQFGDKVRDKAEFVFEDKTNDDYKMSLVYYPSEIFDIKLPKKIKSGKKAEGEIKIKKVADFEKFEKSFTIELNDEAHTRYTIPVTREVRELGVEQSSE
jgi:hypothetical protein